VDSRSTTDPDETSAPGIDSTVAEEVTRVEAVHYLEGASGHGVLSLLFLLGAVILSQAGIAGGSVMAVVVAYGVALNGLSIYAWDRLRLYFATVVGDDDGETASRELTPHRISTEMKAELLTGFTMVGGFAVALAVGLGVLRTVGPGAALSLSVGTLAVVDAGALVWTYRTATS